MKLTNKKKIGLGLIVIVILITIAVGVKYLMNKSFVGYVEPVTFLKEHEDEMTEYIKSQNEKIETVQYDWDTIVREKIGNGTPQGAGEVLRIFGYVNQKEQNDFSLYIEINQKKPMKIKRIYFGSEPDL